MSSVRQFDELEMIEFSGPLHKFIIYLDIVYIKHYLKVNKSCLFSHLTLFEPCFVFFSSSQPAPLQTMTANLCSHSKQTASFIQSRLELYNFIYSPFPVSLLTISMRERTSESRLTTDAVCSSHFLKAFLHQKSHDVEMLGFGFFTRLPLTSTQPSPQSGPKARIRDATILPSFLSSLYSVTALFI